MFDPENPKEKRPNLAEKSVTPPLQQQVPIENLLSEEDRFLWTLRSSANILARYGLGREKGKFVVRDKELLDRLCDRQPGLRETLSKLWTEK